MSGAAVVLETSVPPEYQDQVSREEYYYNCCNKRRKDILLPLRTFVCTYPYNVPWLRSLRTCTCYTYYYSCAGFFCKHAGKNDDEMWVIALGCVSRISSLYVRASLPELRAWRASWYRPALSFTSTTLWVCRIVMLLSCRCCSAVLRLDAAGCMIVVAAGAGAACCCLLLAADAAACGRWISLALHAFIFI